MMYVPDNEMTNDFRVVHHASSPHSFFTIISLLSVLRGVGDGGNVRL